MTEVRSPLQGRMIFLVGARRSGTNWLLRVIGVHPDVALIPSETYLFSRGIKQLRERLHHGVLGSPGTGFVYMDDRETVGALRQFCDRVFLPFLEGAPGKSRLVERTPEHVTCLDVIGEIYPDASVIHLVRDGRDVARSLVAQSWETAPGSIAEAAAEWRDAVEAGESAGRNLARYRSVQYEAMLAEPRKHIVELYSWLGLDPAEDVVEAALLEAQVRFNEDPGAPDIAAGKWRDSFSEGDIAAFMSVAGDTLARFGYDAMPPASASPGQEPAGRPGRRRGLFRQAGNSAKERASLQRSVISQATDNQRLLDRVVAAITNRRPDRLREMFGPTFWVRVVGPDGSWKGRGDAGLQKLTEVIQADPVVGGRQVEGDLHAALPTSTAVMTFAAADGSLHLRVVAMTTQDGAIERIVYYRFPLSADLR